MPNVIDVIASKYMMMSLGPQCLLLLKRLENNQRILKRLSRGTMAHIQNADITFHGASCPRALTPPHKMASLVSGGGRGGRGSRALSSSLLMAARSRWRERLETSSGVGQPRDNGKLCWRRRAGCMEFIMCV